MSEQSNCPCWDTRLAVHLYFAAWKKLAEQGLSTEMDLDDFQLEVHLMCEGHCPDERCELLFGWIDAYVEAFNNEGEHAPLADRFRVSVIDPLTTTVEEQATIATWIDWVMENIEVY